MRSRMMTALSLAGIRGAFAIKAGLLCGIKKLRRCRQYKARRFSPDQHAVAPSVTIVKMVAVIPELTFGSARTVSWRGAARGFPWLAARFVGAIKGRNREITSMCCRGQVMPGKKHQMTVPENPLPHGPSKSMKNILHRTYQAISVPLPRCFNFGQLAKPVLQDHGQNLFY